MESQNNEIKKQLALIRQIDEINRHKPLKQRLAGINSGEYFQNLRTQLNADNITAEAFTVSRLCDYDIYVDGDQIIWEVMQVFPETNFLQVFDWLLIHAEKHHEISITF